MCVATVVIPLFNEEENITGLIADLKQQTANEELFEVIFVNNNSIDGTVKIIEQEIESELLSNCFLVHEVEKGVTAARKRGIDEVIYRLLDRNIDKDHLIINLDGDNRFDEHLIENYINEFQINEHELFYGKSTFSMEGLEILPNLKKFIEIKTGIEWQIKKFFWGRAEGNNFAVRASTYSQYGGLRLTHNYTGKGFYNVATDDWVYSAELISLGATVALVENVTVTLNNRKFVRALDKIVTGNLYSPGWEKDASKKEQDFHDLSDEEFDELLDNQIRGIIIHQIIMNLYLSDVLLKSPQVMNILGDELCKKFARIKEKTQKLFVMNEYDDEVSYFNPSQYIYYKIGKDFYPFIKNLHDGLAASYRLPEELQLELEKPRKIDCSDEIIYQFSRSDLTDIKKYLGGYF